MKAIAIVALFSILAGLAVAVYGQAQSAALTVPALRIVDEQGRTRIALEVVEGQPVIALGDMDGTVRARVSLAGNQPSVQLFDVHGVERLREVVYFDGSPAVILLDREGQRPRVVVASASEPPQVEVFSETGERLGGLP